MHISLVLDRATILHTSHQSETLHSFIYHLHPKDGEGTVFTGVCLSTPGRVPQSQVLSQITHLISFPGGTPVPVPGSFPGYWSQVISGGTLVPVPGSFPGPFQGVPQACHGVPQSWQGYPSPVMGTLSLDGVTPARSGWDTPLARIGLGVHPSQDWGTPS